MPAASGDISPGRGEPGQIEERPAESLLHVPARPSVKTLYLVNLKKSCIKSGPDLTVFSLAS